MSNPITIPATPTTTPEQRRARFWGLIDFLLVLLVFALFGAWPPPDPNEPHYLCKAKHFWDPSWIKNDPFLNSLDAHYVFYLVCGWWTRFLTLQQTAWAGRLLTWVLLAWSWRRLSRTINPAFGLSAVSAALFIWFTETFHLSGEWVVGGFEAKGIAFAFVFLGAADLARGNWRSVWIWFGVASAWHVLVGGWSVLAAAITWLCVGRKEAPLSSLATPLLFGGMASLPGLLPILSLSHGVDAETVALANQVYFGRLGHHLDITRLFEMGRVHYFLVLLFVWIALVYAVRNSPSLRRLQAFAAASLIFAAIGVVITLLHYPHEHEAAGFLRFYWYRFADFAIPMGSAMGIIALIQRQEQGVVWRIGAALIMVALGGKIISLLPRITHTPPRADKADKVTNLSEWKDACLWIRDNTPQDALFLTPRTAQTFKWYAERAELATSKDVPQDPRALVAWRIRLQDAYRNWTCEEGNWQDTAGEHAPDVLQAICKRYSIDYIVNEEEYPLPFTPLYKNKAYAVYRVSDLLNAP